MKPKINKTTATFILIVISIAILIIPALTITFAETQKITHILDVQADYINGTVINPEPCTQASVIDVWEITTDLGESVTNDSAYFGYRDSGINRASIYWTDSLTYIGNGTYNADVNTSIMLDVNYSSRETIVQLDINNSVWKSMDFVKIMTNHTSFRLMFELGSGNVQYYYPIQLTNDEYICINTLSLSSQLTSYPQGKIWIVFDIPVGDENEYFNFNIQSFTLSPVDAFQWTDEQVYMMTVLGCVIILIIGFVFSTNFIDIAVDKSKPRKPNRKSKSKR